MVLVALACEVVAQGRDFRQHAARFDILVDCDKDALIVLVDPAGPACHTGAASSSTMKQGSVGGEYQSR
jgi:hypothetical protein